MQGKPRKIPWISLHSFGRIGTFQWVMTNPNKKNRRALNSPPRLCSPKDPRRQVCLLLRLVIRAIFRQREDIIRYFYLFKENARGWGRTCGSKRRRHGGFVQAIHVVRRHDGTRSRAELSQRLGYRRRSALDVRPKPPGLDAPKRQPWANTGELMRAFGRNSVESRH
jgi:hypothetical protein